jgi:hypothetical protein
MLPPRSLARAAAGLLVALCSSPAVSAGSAPAAGGAPPRGTVVLRDVPGSGGVWHEGVAIISAPRDQVRTWLTEYFAWPRRFTDVEWVQPLGDDNRGWHVVRFRSRIARSTLTVHESVEPGRLVFYGSAPFASIQGRIYLVDRGDGTTLVRMQSTSEPRGAAKLVVTRTVIRHREFAAIQLYLTSLEHLAHARLVSAAPRPVGRP